MHQANKEQGAVVPATKNAGRPVVSKEVKEAKDILTKSLQLMRNNISLYGEDYRRKVREGGLNLMALVINVWPQSTGYSRSGQFIIGNLSDCNVPEERMHDGYIEIPVELEKKAKNQVAPPPQAKQAPQAKGNAGAKAGAIQVHKPQPQGEPARFIRIYERELKDISMEASSFRNVSPGDLVEIIDLVAREYTKDGVAKIYLNAQLCKKTGVYPAELYHALSTNNPRVHFEPIKKRVPNGEVLPKFDDKLLVFNVANPVKDEDLLVPNGMIIEPQISDNEKNWATTGTNGNSPRILFKGYHAVVQWKGPRLMEDNKQHVLVDLCCFHESLSGFYIADIMMWKKLGPVILSSSPYTVVGRAVLAGTDSLHIRTTEKNEGTNVKYDFELSVTANFLFVDAPAIYSKIGIPITPQKARQMHEDKKAELGPAMTDIHKFNAHAMANPPLINLYEYAGDLSHIWDNPDVKCVVLVSSKLNARALQMIAAMKPEEGDEIVSCILQAEDFSTITDLPLAASSGNTYSVCPFLIFQSKLSRGGNRYVKAFLEGISHKEEDHDSPPALPDSQIAPPNNEPPVNNAIKDDPVHNKDEAHPAPPAQQPAPAAPPKAHSKRDRSESHDAPPSKKGKHEKKEKKEKKDKSSS